MSCALSTIIKSKCNPLKQNTFTFLKQNTFKWAAKESILLELFFSCWWAHLGYVGVVVFLVEGCTGDSLFLSQSSSGGQSFACSPETNIVPACSSVSPSSALVMVFIA